MKKIDNEVLQAFQQHHNVTPDGIAYGIQGPSFWVTMLFAGGALALFFQKPYMIGLKGDTLYFIGTSIWKVSTLKPEDKWTLSKHEIKEAKNKKIGPANWMSITLRNGEKKHITMSSLYKGLEKNKEGISAIKQFLGV
jgi:hypothetical protein